MRRENGECRFLQQCCRCISLKAFFLSFLFFSLWNRIQMNAALHGFTCRRALPALYFSCTEWCWFRCPGRCRCYSLHLGKGLGWDRAFGSLKRWTDALFALWPEKRDAANAEEAAHLGLLSSVCLFLTNLCPDDVAAPPATWLMGGFLVLMVMVFNTPNKNHHKLITWALQSRSPVRSKA